MLSYYSDFFAICQAREALFTILKNILNFGIHFLISVIIAVINKYVKKRRLFQVYLAFFKKVLYNNKRYSAVVLHIICGGGK